MVIHQTRPPNYAQIEKAFPAIKGQRGVVYTYGGIIFNPDGMPIDEPLGFHEATHSMQQEKLGNGTKGPEKWWNRYIRDPQFRYEQELEAYRNQFRRFCELHTHRDKRAIFLNRIASDLSSPQYGSVVTLSEAKEAIRSFTFR